MKKLGDFNFDKGVTATLFDFEKFRLYKIKRGKKYYFNLDSMTGEQSHTTNIEKACIYQKEDHYMLFMVLMDDFKNYEKENV